ncbi:MAG: hypothetical protein P8011_16170 [Acidihalobacter sp.]|uniref:hypothetical protein n=1 Tax=Acidihalobacter sp. TaxID=1872108 RepID=UPI00307D0391
MNADSDSIRANLSKDPLFIAGRCVDAAESGRLEVVDPDTEDVFHEDAARVLPVRHRRGGRIAARCAQRAERRRPRTGVGT